VQLKVLVFAILLVLAVSALAAIGLLYVYEGQEVPKQGSPKPPTRREAPKPTAKRSKVQVEFDQVMRRGRYAEARGDWKTAAACYEEAAKLMDSEEAKRRLRAAKLVQQALDLEGLKKWDEALVAYKAALSDAENRTWLEARIARVTKTKAYYDTYRRAIEAEQAAKFDEAINAYDKALLLARELGISTDASRRKIDVQRKAQEAKELKENLAYLVKLCHARRLPYAAIAACEYGRGVDILGDYREVLAQKRKEAKEIIQRNRKDYPPLRAEKDEERDVIELKNGERVEGHIIEELSTAVKVRVRKDGKEIVRLLPTAQIKSRGKRHLSVKELNRKRVRDLFVEAVKACDGKDFLTALDILGRIFCEFGDESLLKDEQLQARLISDASPFVLAKVGDSLQEILKSSVLFCSTMCEYCNGTGKVKCTHCNGTGIVRRTCEFCRGTGKEPCPDCGGTGRVGGQKCLTCRGTGKAPCLSCNGKGYIESRCLYCDNEHKMICPVCHGSGKRRRERR